MHCIDHRISPGARDDGEGGGGVVSKLYKFLRLVLLCVYTGK